MNKYVLSICVALGGLLASCSDDIDLVVPHATNITFSELEIPERFSHVIPDGGLQQPFQPLFRMAGYARSHRFHPLQCVDNTSQQHGCLFSMPCKRG